MHSKLGPAGGASVGSVGGGAIGERVPVVDRYGAVELGAKGGAEARLRCAGAAGAIAHDVDAHERGRWC